MVNTFLKAVCETFTLFSRRCVCVCGGGGGGGGGGDAVCVWLCMGGSVDRVQWIPVYDWKDLRLRCGSNR